MNERRSRRKVGKNGDNELVPADFMSDQKLVSSF